MIPYLFAITTPSIHSEILGFFHLPTDADAIDFGKAIVEDLTADAAAFVGCAVSVTEGNRDVCCLVIENGEPSGVEVLDPASPANV